MKYMIAVDCGGTKTDTVLFDETGHIHHRDVSAGANGMDIGKAEALRRFLGTMERVVPLSPGRVSAIYGGIAGVMPLGDFYTPVVAPKDYADSLRFADDGPSMISATIGHQNGCAMVIGTGSSCFIRIDEQPLRKVGGKGYLIDTGGSGFELGRDALAMAFRAADGRCEATLLTESIQEQMGAPIDQWMERIYDPVSGGRAFVVKYLAGALEVLMWCYDEANLQQGAEWFSQVMLEEFGTVTSTEAALDSEKMTKFYPLEFYEGLCKVEENGLTGMQNLFGTFFDIQVAIGNRDADDRDKVVAAVDCSYLAKAIELYKSNNGIS